MSFPSRIRARAEAGTALVEYALLVALIAVVSMVSISYLGDQTSGTMDDAGKTISYVPDPPGDTETDADSGDPRCQTRRHRYHRHCRR